MSHSQQNIPVTRSFLPPMEDYTALVQRAFDNGWLTNRGHLVRELEAALINHLGVSNVLLMNNGTVPLQIALKLLGRGGEIITTPFSYVATTASIVWEGCTPVFVDIDPQYLTIDEKLIEAAITPRTTAIMATHVFGNPCNTEVIADIAARHGLHVIYDAAHCFGVRYLGKSIFEYGDVSTCSFHATKLFHTGEGGAAFCPDEELRHRVYYSHNFGHNGPLEFHGLGINGKMSELQAAMGLAVLPHMNEILTSRSRATAFYRKQLSGTALQMLAIRPGTEWNHSYFPVLFPNEASLLRTEAQLKANNILPRRYFYPSLNNLPYVRSTAMPVSDDVSRRVLCLPLFAGITEEEQRRIISLVYAN